MTAAQLEAYIALLFQRQDDLGAGYVAQQAEWADAELDKLLQKEGA